MVVGPVGGQRILRLGGGRSGPPAKLCVAAAGITLLWQFVSINGLSIAATIRASTPRRWCVFLCASAAIWCLRTLLGLLTPSTIVGCLALLAAAIGIGIAKPSLALPALVGLAVYALMNIFLTRMIGAWMERWLANRRFREIFGMLMALFAVGIQYPQLPARSDACGRRVRSSWLLTFCTGPGPYLHWLPPGFAAKAILLVSIPRSRSRSSPGLLASTALFAAIFAIRLHKQFLGEHLSEGAPRRAAGKFCLAREVKPEPHPSASSGRTASNGRPAFSPIVAACLRKEWLILRGNGTQLIGMLTPLIFVVILSRAMFTAPFGLFSSRRDCLRPHRRCYCALQHLRRGWPRRAALPAGARSPARRDPGQESHEPGV